ncbi:unnamed protein product [Diamesa serratosioi]
MANALEIVVGTYEEFLLGYRVKPSKSSTRKFDLVQSFSTHSHTSSIRAVATNKHFLASGGADDRICVYDLKKRREIDDLFIHDGTVNTLAFVPDGSYLMSGGADGKIAFIKTSNWKIEKVFEKAHKGSVNYISVHPSGKIALSIGSDLTLRTWNLINGRQAYATSLKNKDLGGIVDHVRWSQTGEYFALTGKDCVEVWDTKKAEVVSTKQCECRPTALCWLTEDNLLIGMENGKLLFFNWHDAEEDATMCEIYKCRIKAMEYLNGFLVTAGSSGELNLWKVMLGDKVEIEMICGVDVGCRLICVSVIEVPLEFEIKVEEDEHLKKSQVKQFVTSGTVTIEVEEVERSTKKLNKKSKKRMIEESKVQPIPKGRVILEAEVQSKPNLSMKKRRKSQRLTNGFIEEDDDC